VSTSPSAFTWFQPRLVYDEHRFVVYGEYYFVLFRYLTGSGHDRPYLATLCGPSGRNMLEDAPVDHLHHHGVWWGHGDVNGVDCYLELPGGEGPTNRGTVTHTGWVEIVDQPDEGRFGFVEDVAWRDHRGDPLIGERRAVSLHLAGDDHYTVDLDSMYTAACDLRFGETKEAVLPGVRVAETLTALVGGTITSSTGATGEEATMGRPAQWVDVSGTRRMAFVGEELVEGLACLDHSANPGHPQRFFTRAYGPISPFPGHYFHDDRVLAEGERIRLRHRLVVHRSDAASAGIVDHYERYSQESAT
jgi:Methane oxygenase PmoA